MDALLLAVASSPLVRAAELPPRRAAVAYVSTSACLTESVTVVRAQFALPPRVGSATAGHGGLGTEADGRTACKAFQRLAPELLGGFFCSDPGGSGGSGGSERPSYPRLAIFSGNLLGHGARAQFPFVQGKGAQQGEPQRIGEFSFEIPRSSRDLPLDV